MSLHVNPDGETTARAAADAILALIDAARGERGAAHVALAGGGTPRRTYELLRGAISDWDGIHIWFGDERCVGPDDPDSNFKMARESLLAGVDLPDAQMHRMRGELEPAEGARAYERELLDVIGAGDEGLPAIDVQILGLGPEGHTASLFPHHPLLDVDDALVAVITDSPKPPPTRLTLTLPALRASRRILFLADGPSKADAIAAMLRGPDREVPASLLMGDSTDLYVDAAAAGEAQA